MYIVDNIQNLCSNELMWQKDNKQKTDSEEKKTEKEFLEIIFFDGKVFVLIYLCLRFFVRYFFINYSP